MTETIPPLPELKILETTSKNINQQDLDHVLQIVYEQRPDLFASFAEREKQNLGVEGYGEVFYKFMHDEVWKHVAKPPHVGFAAASILGEARRRARLMYGLPPDKIGYVPNPRKK